MAHFLDPELAALVAQESRQAAAPARSTSKGSGRIIPNKFPKMCSGACGKYVEAGKGRLEKDGGAWKVFHLTC